MAALNYPATLPSPTAWRVRPDERRVLRTLREPANANRLRSTDYGSTVDAEWIYTAAEMAVGKAWYEGAAIDQVDRLRQFNAALPGRGGIVARVARYLTPPQRTLLGNGVWRVTAQLRVRAALVAATYYFTSWLYPIDSEQTQIQMGGAIPVSGNLISWPSETVKVGAVYPTAGTLDTILKTHTPQLTETVKVGSVYPTAGMLDTVLKTYTNQLTETIKVGSVYPVSGLLDVVLVSYTNHISETVKVGSVYPVAGTLA